MAWALLGIAGILEIAFAFCMKWSEGFTRLIPGLFTARHWLVECLSSLTLTPHAAGGDRLRGLDGYRRGGHRDSGNGGAGRLRCAAEDALHCSHFGRRDRIKAGFGKLRTIAGRGRLNPIQSSMVPDDRFARRENQTASCFALTRQAQKSAAARKLRFDQSIQKDLVVQSLAQKYSAFLSPPNQRLFPRCPVSTRGAYRDRHERGTGCGGRRQRQARKVVCRAVIRERAHRARRTALKRTAKPCGPDTRGWCQAVGGEFDPTGSI